MCPASTVLYVGANRTFRDIVVEAGECSGFEVEVTASVSEALDKLDEGGVDCILSDYALPDRSGLDLLTAVRDRAPELPFLLCPEEGSEAIASEAISSGVTDYVRKDTIDDAGELAGRIEDGVSQYRETRQTIRTNRRLRELLTSTTDCLWMFDASWEELLFISGYEKIWNRPAEEIRQNPQDFLNGVHPEDQEFVEEAMKRLSSGDDIDIEYRIRKESGETGWVWVKGQPIVEDGTVVRIAGFTRDITERKERERELELRTQAINEAPVGVILTDPSRADNPITYANEKFLELTGYDSEEILGQNCRFLQGEQTDNEPVRRLREAVDTAESVTVELLNYRKDGTRFWNKLSLAPVFGDSGTVRNYIGFQEDVTDRRQRQQQLQVLDRVLRHNLRNRIGVIRSHAEILQSSETIDGTEHTDSIIEQCEKLIDIAEKERLVTKTLSDPTEATIDVRPMLSGVATSVHDSYPDATVSIHCRDDVSVVSTPLLEKAFEELLTNALNHTAEPSPEVTVTVTVEGEAVHVDVADTGPPIPEMERALLQGREESPLEHGGGIGLWFVNLVVNQSDGSIDVRDNDRGGNTIRVILPREQP